MERSNFIDIQKQVQTLDNLFQEHINNVKEAINVYSQFASVAKTTFPSEVIKNAKDIDAISAKLATTLSRQARVHTALNKEMASGYVAAQKKLQLERTQLSLQQQKDRLNAKELKRLEQLNNAYNRIEALMKRAIAEYNNLAARKNFGIQLTQKEEARYLQLQARIERFNGALKKTDADIGKFIRDVGNYGKHWDGLRFQTNQLIRELPAMAYGVNVFFGAISNNLPMFIDEVNKAREAQKLAIAEGKTAPSVISRIAGALFNWQTALVLGITYLTLHGKEVMNWVKSLWGGKQAIDDLAKAQLAYNKSREQSILATQKDINTLEQNLKIAKNTALSMDVRKEAIKQIRKEYEYHSKALTDNNFLLGQTEEFEERVTKAIEAHNQVIKHQNTIDKNKERVIQLQEELRLRQQFEEQEKRLIEEQNKYSKGSIANRLTQKGISDEEYKTLKNLLDTSKSELEALREKEKIRIKERKDTGDVVLNLEKTSEIQEVINQLLDDNAWAQESINRLREISIELDIKEEKAKKEKTKANYDYVDVLAAEYELMRLLYEIEIERNRKVFEDEKATYSERGKAMKEMYDNQLALIELTRNEEIRLAEISSNELREKAKKARKDGVITEEEYRNELINISQVYAKKLTIIDENYKNKKNEINNEIAKSYDVVIKQQWEYLKNLNAINQLEQNRSSSNVAFLEKATLNTILKDYEDYENKKNEIAEDAQKERINLRLKELERELASNRYSADKYQELQAEKIQLEKEFANIQQKNAEEHAKRLLELARKYKSFFNDVIRDAYGSFPSLYDFIHGGFSEMLEQSGKMVSEYQEQIHSLEGTLESLREAGEEGSQEYNEALSELETATQNLSQLQIKMALSVAVQVTEIFQDMYNLMQQNADAYFQRQFELLEMQKDIAIKNAGESTVAREEIERQYEEKRRQIERERAKQQKEQAMFNAIINLAQGIMATIGQLGFPAAIPMIALVSALGAVQIGMIASQPLPAYAEGTTNHIGGPMLVNDGNGSNYRETVVTPDGKIIQPQGRNVIMNAPKGTQVFTHEQWQKRVGSILNGDKNQYNYPVNNGITKEDLKEILSEQSRHNNPGDKFEVNIDRQGINATIIRGANRVKKLNSRIRIKRNH